MDDDDDDILSVC